MTIADLERLGRKFRPTKQAPPGVPGSRLLDVDASDQTELIRALRAGLESDVLERVGRRLLIDPENETSGTAARLVADATADVLARSAGLVLARLIGMSESTYRRRQGGCLSPKESEGVYRYAALFERAADVLGSEASARAWIRGPVFALGGAIPLDFARTEPGAAFALQVLGRLEHGVYS